MPAPTTAEQFLELVRNSGLVDPQRLDPALASLRAAGDLPEEPRRLAGRLVRHGLLTTFHAREFLRGVWRGFNIGKYRILEQLGCGGMGVVYLADDADTGNRVALKVLPLTLAQNRWFLDRFYEEAKASTRLDHPNIIRAHHIDHDGNIHFIVMEYVDGASFQHIVSKGGPLDPLRAAHYIRQAAFGLAHIAEHGLVHRDIKPANLLLSRQGVVKVLDLGLACFARQERESAGKDKQVTTLGTDDYLAPEQIVDYRDVDVRADIYSLGATFYFLLTGRPPFEEEEKTYLKLIRHLARRPQAVRELRPDVPEGLAAVVEQMMAKNPWDRPQKPAAVIAALEPWTRTPIPPPPPEEMPRLCALICGEQPGVPSPSSFPGSASAIQPVSSAGSSSASVWVIELARGSTRAPNPSTHANQPLEITSEIIPVPAQVPVARGRKE